MTIRVALNHRTSYRFDRPVKLWPHEIRLRPAAHCRTPITGYSLRVAPEPHFINWQQDVAGNWVARLVFPEMAEYLTIEVDLIAEMTVINPFDFFVEEDAAKFPFRYAAPLQSELAPFLETGEAGNRFETWLQQLQAELLPQPTPTVDLLVALNRRTREAIGYVVRLEAGVQSPEETLALGRGSCRDSAWLLVHVLRRLGFAARFVSGYLIQLTADQKSLDGPSGPEQDFTDLHAWVEAYVPGAGWIGLDPTSGLMAGEGHLPLACTASPITAAPVTGATGICQSTLDFQMTVTRIHEDPRVTKPYRRAQWQAILELGETVDRRLAKSGVRLTQGGEPTFVSIDNMEGPEWTVEALSPKKLELAENLLLRLRNRFAPGGILIFGQGKWYPGEPLPRWALSCLWRTDGKPLWRDPALSDAGDLPARTSEDARRLMTALAHRFGLSERFCIPAFEDAVQVLDQESRWPENFDPASADLKDGDERRRLARLLAGDLAAPVGYVLPLKPLPRRPTGKGTGAARGWRSSPWPLRRQRLYLVAGDSPIGLRLPLASLPWVAPDDVEVEFDRDPFENRGDLADSRPRRKKRRAAPGKDYDPREIVHTALCAEVRNGIVHLFLPPVSLLEDWIELINTIEATVTELNLPVRFEGYGPPNDPRLRELKITPDPGVIEVNIHPAASWRELVANTTALYEEARLTRLATEKFMLDGRHTGTGGGNHVTLGGATAADSPLLRRPDLLMSLITYWQNHPALSYLFSGTFIGPTSQAPRVDEARHESLYELEIAFQQLQAGQEPGQESLQPWLVDRLLRNLLVDLSGNTHRAEFCIDKLYSPDGPAGRLGLLEFRGFEMPPHPEMSMVQMLLLRALVARFWHQPYRGRLIRWGTELHDKFMLPHYVQADLDDVIRDLRHAGYAFDAEWFAPFAEFRFPRYGTVAHNGIEIELRQAIEPWHVLGEEISQSGTARYVDSSVERLQVMVKHMMDGRHLLACNGRPVPLTPTGVRGEFVAGVRYKAWNPSSSLHPTIGVQSPLVFDLVDTWNGRSIGGCTYHVIHPGGRNYQRFPVNAFEAEARRVARFRPHGHTPGPLAIKNEPPNPDYPRTLDLRRTAEY